MTINNFADAISPLLATQCATWQLVDTIRGGTTAMRAAGRTYLPQEEKEKDKNYDTRLSRSTFDNYYIEAIDRAVDKVFARDIVLKDQPVEVQLWWEDVDTQGRDGTQFAKDVFFNAVHHGVTYLLTDYPRLPQDQPFKNRAEELSAARRPYWVNIKAPEVLAADSAFSRGTERLVHFRYKETVYEPGENGLVVREVNQIRQYDDKDGVVSFIIWRQDEEGWKPFDEGVLSTPSIPVVPIYGKRIGFYLGSPVQLPLAELNVQHWRKRSDLDNILHIANVPFLFGKGFNTQQIDPTSGGRRNDKIEVDIQQAVMSNNKDADLKWVEHTGSNIKTAMDDIANLENRMRDLGSTLFSSGGGFMTSATEKSINAAEANARLKSLALSLQDGLEMSLFFVCEYMGIAIAETAKIEVNTSFSVDYVANETMAGVISLYKMGLIGQDVVIAEAKRRNIIALDQDVVIPTNPKLGKSADNEVIPPVVVDESGNKVITVNT